MTSRVVNLTLPAGLLEEIDRAARAEHRTRSELIREAIRRYLRAAAPGGPSLRESLTEGYQETAERDRVLADEWFRLEEEAATD